MNTDENEGNPWFSLAAAWRWFLLGGCAGVHAIVYYLENTGQLQVGAKLFLYLRIGTPLVLLAAFMPDALVRVILGLVRLNKQK